MAKWLRALTFQRSSVKVPAATWPFTTVCNWDPILASAVSEDSGNVLLYIKMNNNRRGRRRRRKRWRRRRRRRKEREQTIPWIFLTRKE